MKPTLQERYIKMLNAYKFTEQPSKSAKYRHFTKPTEIGTISIFLGKNGSVRAGRNITASISMSDSYKHQLIKFENKEKTA